MKYLVLLMLSAGLVSCSKDSDDEQDPDEETTVKFINQLPRSFQNVKIGSINSSGHAVLIKDVGVLPQNGNTGEIVITNPSVMKVYFYYDEADKTYYTDYGFTISAGTFNNWNITTSTIFHQVQKSSQLYPK